MTTPQILSPRDCISAICAAKTYDDIMKIKLSHLDGIEYETIADFWDAKRIRVGMDIFR